MALQNFVDQVGPVVDASWLNQVDVFVNSQTALPGQLLAANSAGASGQVLTSQGTGQTPLWENPSVAAAPTITTLSNITWTQASVTGSAGNQSVGQYEITNPGSWLTVPGRCSLTYQFTSTGFFAANPLAHFVTAMRHNNSVTTSNDGHGAGIGNVASIPGFSGEDATASPAMFLETWYGTGNPNNYVWTNAEDGRPYMFQDGVTYLVKVDSTRGPDGQMYIRSRAWAQVLSPYSVNVWQLVIDTGDNLDGNPYATFLQSGLYFAMVFGSSLSNWTLAFTNIEVVWGASNTIATDASTKYSRYGGILKGALNYAAPASLAATSSMAIGAAQSNYIYVNSAGTITSFDTIASGAERTLVFGAVCTLNNSTAIQLPGGANITVAVNDVMRFTSSGGGNWFCSSYQPIAGYQIGATGGALPLAGGTMTGPVNYAFPASLTAASSMAIGASSSNIGYVSGSATINSFDIIANGAQRTLVFAAACTIVNSASMLLPGSANITTAAGDTLVFTSSGGGNWVCTDYQPRVGYLTLAGGKINSAANAIGTASALFPTRTGFGGSNATTLTGTAWTAANLENFSSGSYLYSYFLSNGMTTTQANALATVIAPAFAFLSCFGSECFTRNLF